MRHLLIASFAFCTIVLYLLALATGNTSKLAEYYWYIFALNSIVLLGLISLIAHQILRLRSRLRRREFGSKLTQKLTWMFAVVALIPGVLVVTVSTQFLTRSIESWFDVRVESALDRGLGLGRNALGFVLQDVTRKSKMIFNEISSRSEALLPAQLEHMREQFGLTQIVVYSNSRQVIAYASANQDGSLVGFSPGSINTHKLSLNRPQGSIETLYDNSLELRVLTRYHNINNEQRFLLVSQKAPETIVRDANLIENARNEYTQLLLSRNGLKTFYILTLLMSFMLALTAVLAFALYMSERLSAPLSDLAAGTRAVGQGDFSKRHTVYRRDELGMLTALFNRMTQQLEDARGVAEQNRQMEEAARLYLESVLANLSAGVIAFDANWFLRTANLSASEILRVNLSKLSGKSFFEWGNNNKNLTTMIDVVEEQLKNNNGQWQRQFEYQTDDSSLILLARGTPLSEKSSAGGYVIVFNDITDLLRAQRDAAWGEVAKRLAHEIRNPLTPIQLSAERLAMKLESKLDKNDAAMLHKSTDTIIKQVSALKGMVDAFRDYARVPRMRLAPIDLNQVIREVLTLYEGNHALKVTLSEQALTIMGDHTLLRQVFHNLLQNAQDAVLNVTSPIIHISSFAIDSSAKVSVVDNGLGFSSDVLPRAFEPYVTNKTKGTGLGLAVVKKIVEEHDGTINVCNVKPQGAQVLMTLPLLEAHYNA